MQERCVNCCEEYDRKLGRCPWCGFSGQDEAEDSLYIRPGTPLADRYILGRTLGVGGFGITYVAWDEHLRRKVAIKEYLPSEFSTRVPGQTHVTIFSGEKGEQFYAGLEKFIDEAKSLARFHSIPGIVKIFDTIEANGTAYIIMELLEGETLARRLEREGTIPADEAVDIILEVLESLEPVHRGGMLHRDIAPDNIFITKEGQPKLIDFGAARFATTTRSRSITVIIKPGYSPEEQYRSHSKQGAYTDIYAIGATLYRMITGSVPPDALERRAEIEAKRRDPLVRLKGNTAEGTGTLARLRGGAIRLWRRTTALGARTCAAVCGLLAGGRDADGRTQAPAMVERRMTTAAIRWRELANAATPRYGITRSQATAIMNTLNVRVQDRTQDIPTFIRELRTESAVERRASRINTTDYLGLTRMRIVSAVAVLVCCTMLVLSLTGVFSGSGGDIVIPDGMTRVPQVVNTDVALAGQSIEAASLLYQIAGNEYSDAIPENRLLSQSVNGGSVVSKNTVIELVVSVGERTRTVPNVLGYPQTEAEQSLEQSGFTVRCVSEYSPCLAEGCVIAQSITAGNDYPENGEIVLTLSAGCEPGYVFPASSSALPELAGKSFGEAMALAQEYGFTLRVVGKEYSDAAAEDVVLRHTPGGGETFAAGDEVGLVLSLGQERVKTPDVVYMQAGEAQETVEARGLVFAPEYEYSASVAKGVVIRQSPLARQWVSPGTKATVVVSLGPPPFPMPSLSGMTEEEARKTLEAAGLVISVSYEKSADVPEGEVLYQSVPADSEIVVGTTVGVAISTGIKLLTVPDVKGDNVDQAVARLEKEGFVVEVNRVYSDTVGRDTVIDQSLEAGSTQLEGSTVYLNVSRGRRPAATTTTTRRTTTKTAARTTTTTKQTAAATTTRRTYATTTTTTTTRSYTTTRPTG